MSRLAGKKAIRSYARKLADPDDIRDLNITPMMDMMTIILVFLLKTFTSTSTTLNMNEDLRIPGSQTQDIVKEAINVTVTKSVILIEGEAVATVNKGRVDPSFKPQGENGYFIKSVGDTLAQHAKRETTLAKLRGEAFAGEIMLVADTTTPYRLLTEVLYSAGQAGYANYRLLVLKRTE